MPVLEMHLEGILIAKMPLEYEGFTTVAEREDYQGRCAMELYERHRGKVRLTRTEPEFFIDHVQSRMNEHMDWIADRPWETIIANFYGGDKKIRDIIVAINTRPASA